MSNKKKLFSVVEDYLFEHLTECGAMQDRRKAVLAFCRQFLNRAHNPFMLIKLFPTFCQAQLTDHLADCSFEFLIAYPSHTEDDELIQLFKEKEEYQWLLEMCILRNLK